MASPSLPKIAIIGAGPSGLTLASLLHKSSLPFNLTIFDLRPLPSTSPSALNTASGSLDLHPESGLLALEKCGLISQFKTLSSECSEETIIADKQGIVRYEDDGHGGDRPEISRNALTALLLSSAPKGLFGKSV
jgi:2-polyprenyl-6-methoxyphenol hydroxylase-like FAD-dependent oxidoreductase